MSSKCFHHCFCKMLSNGIFFCCRCGAWEILDTQKNKVNILDIIAFLR